MSGQMHFKLNGRIWVETPDEKVLGHGRVELLERIHACGSLRQAALQMGMSYKRAWDLAKHMNENLSEPVIVLQRGGSGGGKAMVTEKGLDIVVKYNELQVKFQEFLKKESNLIEI